MASNATAGRIPTNLLSGPLAMSPGDLRKQHAALSTAAKSAVAALREAHCLTLAGLVEKEEATRCSVLAAAGPTSGDYAAVVAAAAEVAMARVRTASPDLERVLQVCTLTLGPTPDTRHAAAFTLHPTASTLHPAPYALRPPPAAPRFDAGAAGVPTHHLLPTA